ncbi:hypothetical protein Clacol_007278 [Clathrus columnatus]|uniref:Uncharacterized protein n=1 Tax=Clathrus columnatus TaxID=1419009 RepID=A0AAV5AK14_9AGAM|nr:hypothetical protein Clacol_007278 [Clathrus columnatus]
MAPFGGGLVEDPFPAEEVDKGGDTAVEPGVAAEELDPVPGVDATEPSTTGIGVAVSTSKSVVVAVPLITATIVQLAIKSLPMTQSSVNTMSSPVMLAYVFGAVLTSTLNIYYPFAHNNHQPASENGDLSYIGDENGVTTYLFTEPQSPGVTATFIEGEHVAVIIALNNPSFLASYSCDVQVTQAVCLLVNMDPQNGGAVTGFTTDSPIDSLAMLVVGLPGETPQPTASTPPPPTSPTSSSSTSSPPPAPSNSPTNQNSSPSPTPKETTPATFSQTPQLSQLSPSSQSSQTSLSSTPSQTNDANGGSNGSNGLPAAPASGNETPSQSSTTSQKGSRPTLGFPSDNQGGDQNLLPGSGSTKTTPTMANLMFLNLVLVYLDHALVAGFILASLREALG